jgi:hypothetical protein
MPQLQTGIRDQSYQHDGAPPHFHNEVGSYLDEHLRNRWIGHGGPMEWPPRSPDLTPMGFFFVGFCEGQCLRSPAADTTRAQDTDQHVARG